MPMDGVMIGAIVDELKDLLIGGRVDKITQPEQDEAHILIRNAGSNLTLLVSASANNSRVHLTSIKKNNPLEPPMFCMLMRKHLGGARVKDVRQINGDRIVEIEFEVLDDFKEVTSKILICEIMGRHSNVILTDASKKIIDSIRHVTHDISRVRAVLPGLTYERPPQQNKLPYDNLDQALLASALSGQTGPLYKIIIENIGGISSATARELALRITGSELTEMDFVEPAYAARQLMQFFTTIGEIKFPQIVLRNDGAPLDVTAFAFTIYQSSPKQNFVLLGDALDKFYVDRDNFERAKQRSAAIYRVLRNNIERCEKKLGLQTLALQNSDRMEEYRIKGELLTTYFQPVPKGQPRISIPNYYDPECKEISIDLDISMSLAQNAQRYFKLYKKAKSAQTLAASQIKATKEELDYLEGQLNNLEKCTEESELNELRHELEQQGYIRASHNRKQAKKLPPSSPLHYLSSAGISIFVGKNNRQNEELTQSANSTDLWLHAKDMPGSHVIVRHNNPDDTTLREAALLAAFYSKGKQSSQVLVDYTLRKYVKKPSGSKPGFVNYTHQKTIYVTPTTDAVQVLQQVR